MRIIEPCCVRRQLLELRDAISKGGTKQFQGYGDMSITELLPAILTRYSEVEMLIAAPSLPDQAAEIIERWMKKQWAMRTGNGKLDVVRKLTIIADLSPDKSPTASGWLTDNPFGERMKLVNIRQEETAILLPDFAITGPVNMRYGYYFVATATTMPADVSALWEKFRAMMEEKAPSCSPEGGENEGAPNPVAKENAKKKKKASKKKASA